MTLNVPVFGLDSEETATRDVTSGVLFEIVWSRLRDPPAELRFFRVVPRASEAFIGVVFR
jgi:hypothetical protein